MSKKTIALVIQRFGPEVVGGAENYAFNLAEAMHRRLDYEVHVYTTCAKSYSTWKNEYPAGESSAEFGKIFRFKTIFPRWPLFGLFSRLFLGLRNLIVFLGLPHQLTEAIEWLWLVAQGPIAPKLIRQLKNNQSSYDCAVLMTYLYWPTLAALKSLSIRRILVPLAHDEPPLFFRLVRARCQLADHVLANIAPEADLIRRANLNPNVTVAGAGIHFPTAYQQDLSPRRETNKPYLLYLGRVSRGKGIDRLISYMKKPEIRQLGLRLLFAGKMDSDIKPLLVGLDAEFLGFVSEREKNDLIMGALAVVNPSGFESLSIITLEALLAKTPALLNKSCDVLNYYCENTETCFGFNDFESFMAAIYRLGRESQQPDWGSKLLRSREWVQHHFSWDLVIKNFQSAIECKETNILDGRPFSGSNE